MYLFLSKIFQGGLVNHAITQPTRMTTIITTCYEHFQVKSYQTISSLELKGSYYAQIPQVIAYVAFTVPYLGTITLNYWTACM